MARPFTTMRLSALRSPIEPLLRVLRSSAAAWLAVLTVLSCAVLPAGLPHSAAYGSAFNPANSSVALVAKGPQRRFAIEQKTDPHAGDDLSAPSSGSVFLLPGVLRPLLASATGPAVVAVAIYPRLRPASPKHYRAREPPAVRGG